MNDLSYRSLSIEKSSLDIENRTVEVTFSTETPVKRRIEGGVIDEILLHGKENVDLSRISSVGAVLLNHDPNKIIGSILDVSIVGRQGKALVRFDDDSDGNWAMSKVASGSLRGVSTGYNVSEFYQVYRGESWTNPETGSDHAGPALVAMRWMPAELTFTPVPADVNSKIGRDLAASLEGIDINNNKRQEREMEKAEVQAIIDSAIRGLEAKIPKADDIISAVRTAIQEDAKPKLAMEVQRAQELASQAAAVSEDCQRTIQGMIINGKTEVECLRQINKTLVGDSEGKVNGGGDLTRTDKFDFAKIDDDAFVSNLRSLDDFQVEGG